MILTILSLLGLLILALLCLTILVVVHEFGHFWVAKKNGILVEEFGVGLPPRIWGKRIGETLYSINAIPLGGFVKLHGETSGDQVFDPARAFVNKGTLARSLTIIAGIAVNFLFGILLFAGVYTFIPEEKTEPLGYVQILEVVPSSPAQTVGILPGDKVIEINDSKVTTNDEVIKIVGENKGNKIKIEVERETEGQKEVKTFNPLLDNTPPADGTLGIKMADSKVSYVYPPLWQRPLLGIKRGLIDSFSLTQQIIFGLGNIASDASQGKVPTDLAGPTKLIAFLIYIIRTGALETIHLMAVISINLAVFNILPIPPLDGSRLAVILGERLLGKKMGPKIENFVNIFGMALLLGLVIFITAREIPEFIKAGTLTRFVEESLRQ